MKNELIEMTDGDETIEVHASNVIPHQKLGWKLVHPEDMVKIAQGGFLVPATHDPRKLIKVFKDGQTMEVHPDALADHQKLGWTVIDQEYLKKAVETAEKQVPAETAVPARRPPTKRG